MDYRIAFEEMEWEQVRPDVRQKVHREADRLIRLVEFGTSDGAEHWCDTGHIGYVLRGALRISFDGKELSFAAGDGLFIPAGKAHQHRATWIADGTQLLMIEELPR